MGLYLAIFDNDQNELDAVEVGSYADFNFFRDAVIATVEKGMAGKKCPTLINHSDNDGQWTPVDASALLLELDAIARELPNFPPVELNAEWKLETARVFGITPKSLLDCFFDIDGISLVERLQDLSSLSVEKSLPILFQ